MNFSHEAPKIDNDTLEKIKKILYSIKEIDLGTNGYESDHFLTTYILTQAISNILGLRFVEGLYAGKIKHCWVASNDGNIFDINPIGNFGGPVVVDRQAPCTKDLYKEEKINNFVSCYQHKINLIVSALYQKETAA